MRIAAIVAGVLLSWAAAAAGQTTRPADLNWGKAVDAFARALADGDRATLNLVLAEKPTWRRFGEKESDAVTLLGLAAKGTMLGAHAYVQPPETMVADLASDFKSASTVPDELKHRMTPQDDAEMTRAKATAVQWVEQSLGVKAGQPVGVVVLWCPKPSDDSLVGLDPVMEPVFILLQGVEISTYNFRIKAIVFGDPLAEGK